MNRESINQRLNTLKRVKEKLRKEISLQKKQLELDEEALKQSKILAASSKLKSVETTKSSTPTIKKKKQEVVSAAVDNGAKNEEAKKLEYLKLRDKFADQNFFNRIKPLLDEIPESNGSRFFKKLDVNIGIIADEFLFNSFNGIANLTYITQKNYRDFGDKLDIFLLVSTWKGLGNEWRGLGNPKSEKRRNEVNGIIEFYKSKGIKIVFYSKEDPTNYDRFIDLAKKCEHIFTTAEEKVNDYKKDCDTDNVNVLSFGINPLYHNPIGIKKFPKKKEILFAGSWYNKYPHRVKDTKVIFDGVMEGEHNLKIIDRNYDLNLPQHFFPEEYVKFISPAIDHSYIQKLHKLYDWSINLNSIKYSETMFANRVYELQALGNILLSNYNTGINNKFPNVFQVHNKSEVKDILNGFTEDEKYKHQMYGVRKVMSSETTFHRLQQLIETVGIPVKKVQRSVAVLVKERTNHILEMFNRQTYEDKELLLETEFNDTIIKQYDIIAFFDEINDYGEFYLEDMINAFKYTNSDYITKDACYSKGQFMNGLEHNFVLEMKDKNRTIFWRDSFTAKQLLGFNQAVKVPNGYSIDHFEYNEPIYKLEENKEHELAVIIPTYNNGEHLLNKCFNSLRRSSIFNSMEIVIVDDGSTDEYTTKIISRLAKKYSNVKTFFFNDGGSGSASRPRNKGFEISTAPFITYLDPDNEAINDGYAKLYKEITTGTFDFVVGNIVRVSDKEIQLNYYNTVMRYNNNQIINGNMEKFLIDSDFKAVSIQALIVKREIIGENKLEMVIGAAGQDTLFYHELLLHSKYVKAVNVNIHVYYAAVAGSTVNNISKKFYEKYYKLEVYRVNFFKKQGMLDEYLEKRYEFYFKNWYLNKLKLVKEEDAQESIDIIFEIFNLYKDEFKPKNKDILHFITLCEKKDYEQIIAEFIKSE